MVQGEAVTELVSRRACGRVPRRVRGRPKDRHVSHPYVMVFRVISVQSSVLIENRLKPDVHAVAQRGVVIDSLDFKADACLGPPYAVDFFEDLAELVRTPAASAEVNTKGNTIDGKVRRSAVMDDSSRRMSEGS